MDEVRRMCKATGCMVKTGVVQLATHEMSQMSYPGQQVLAPFFAHYDLNGCDPRAASAWCFVRKSTYMR